MYSIRIHNRSLRCRRRSLPLRNDRRRSAPRSRLCSNCSRAAGLVAYLREREGEVIYLYADTAMQRPEEMQVSTSSYGHGRNFQISNRHPLLKPKTVCEERIWISKIFYGNINIQFA